MGCINYKLFSLITILVISIYTNAQELERENIISEYYNYKEMALEAEKRVPSLEKKYLNADIYKLTDSLNLIAEYFGLSGNYSKAQIFYTRSKDLIDKAYQENPSKYKNKYLNKYSQLLYEIAYNEFQMGNFLQAESYIQDLISLNPKKNNPYLIDIIQMFAAMGNYNAAENLCKPLIDDGERKIKEDWRWETYNSLALLYYYIGKYSEAERLFHLALSRKGAIEMFIYENLSYVYYSKGDYNSAEKYLRMSLTVDPRAMYWQKQYPGFTLRLRKLAIINIKLGNYSAAENLLKVVLERQEIEFGKFHIEYSKSLLNLAQLYIELGNYKEAEEEILNTLENLKESLFESHPVFAEALIYLAEIYYYKNDYNTAERTARQAIEINTKTLGYNNIVNIKAIKQLAFIYQKIGNSKSADSLLNQAVGIIESSYDKNSINIALIEEQRAALYINQKKYAEAEVLLKHVLIIKEEAYGQNHPDYASTLIALAKLYFYNNKNSEVEVLLKKANGIINNQISSNLWFLSEVEKERLIESTKESFSFINSFALNQKLTNPEIVSSLFNNEISHKGIILQNNVRIIEAINDVDDSVFIKKVSEYNDVKNKLGRQYTVNAKRSEIDSLEKQANSIEKELNIELRNNKVLQTFSDFQNKTWLDIKSFLKDGEMAIEFISFQYDNGINLTDSIFYCALLLKNNYEYPKMIYLFEERQLKSILPKSFESSYGINTLYSFSSSENTDGYIPQDSQDNRLNKLIWQPISNELNGVKHIFIAPTGLLNLISFAALPIAKGEYLSDRFDIEIISSSAKIIEKRKIEIPKSIALYGGLQYDLDSNEMIENTKLLSVNDSLYYANKNFDLIRGGEYWENWSYLDGTKNEVEKINKLFYSNAISTYLYLDKNGVEESFKSLNILKPEAIHIATHGFYFEYPNNNNLIGVNSPFKKSDNPLMRCGLIMSGANRAWNRLPLPNFMEDGVLTGYEISQTNLSNVKLVVLSACQTGLGEIRGSEGVYGLQRAFKMAGVDFLLISLWSVPDTQTAELMELFYKNWLSGNDIQKAFKKAQLEMRKKYSPYYWAAFELIN